MRATNWIFYVLALVVTVVLALVFCGSPPANFLDLPSALVVLGGSYLLACFAHGATGVCSAYGAALSSRSTPAECRKAVEVFKGLQGYFILTGLLGTLMGTIAMVTWQESQGAGTPGNYVAGAAVAVLTLLYALVALLFLVLPFKAAAAAKATEGD